MFQVAKVWVDQEPDIEVVEVAHICTGFGEAARFDGRERCAVMEVVPGSDPLVRRAILEIPRFFDAGDAYLLHYRFRSGSRNGETLSPVFTEEIVSAEVEYLDLEGALDEVRVLWSVRGWSAPNWSPAAVDGSAQRSAFPPARLTANGSRPVGSAKRFVARVSGPRGASVEYVYQLHPGGAAVGADAPVVWDNADEHDYHLTLL
ncbi:MAG: hypothetical protein ACRDV9_15075 [Acidimicrobiia bacterium]